MEELGIIKGINVGMRDAYSPICWFSVDTLSGGSLQVLSIEEMAKLIEKHNIYKLSDLNDKPCIMKREGSIMTFIGLKV
jgi:hypothetical protein